MTYYKKVITLITIALFNVMTVNSQSKVGHINTQKLISSMPEMTIVQIELEKLLKQYSNEYRNMEQTVESKREQYLKEYDAQTIEENKSRNDEIRSLLQNINNFKNGIQFELSKKEKELTTPLIQLANEAIIKVGKAQGFDYVLDSTDGQGVILANGKDLMSDVKIELGF
jgi:outer membrane protein